MEGEMQLELAEQTRKYGFFYCKECFHDWESDRCWPGKWQKCPFCEREIYPFQMLPLSQVWHSSYDIGPHFQNLCQKCIETGTNCENL